MLDQHLLDRPSVEPTELVKAGDFLYLPSPSPQMFSKSAEEVIGYANISRYTIFNILVNNI